MNKAFKKYGKSRYEDAVPFRAWQKLVINFGFGCVKTKYPKILFS